MEIVIHSSRLSCLNGVKESTVVIISDMLTLPWYRKIVFNRPEIFQGEYVKTYWERIAELHREVPEEFSKDIDIPDHSYKAVKERNKFFGRRK